MGAPSSQGPPVETTPPIHVVLSSPTWSQLVVRVVIRVIRDVVVHVLRLNEVPSLQLRTGELVTAQSQLCSNFSWLNSYDSYESYITQL